MFYIFNKVKTADINTVVVEMLKYSLKFWNYSIIVSNGINFSLSKNINLHTKSNWRILLNRLVRTVVDVTPVTQEKVVELSGPVGPLTSADTGAGTHPPALLKRV